MTTQTLTDKLLEKYPFVFPNPRGSYKAAHMYLRYGIPLPPSGRREKPEDMKGSDFIGLTETGQFIGVEIKGDGDRIKPGQVRFHNWVIDHRGRSEIWFGDGTVIDYKIEYKEIPKKWRVN